MTKTRTAIPLLVAVVMLIAAPSAYASAPAVGPISAVEGTAVASSTVIASFDDGTDLFGCNPASDYAAAVDWGDGTGTQSATVAGPVNPTFLAPCVYGVEAGHTYSEFGTYTVTVAVAGGNTPGEGTGAATVADAPLGAGASIDLQPTADAQFSGAVANFNDGNPDAGVGDYSTVTIDWGDGTPPSAGTVTATSTPGQFAVSGTHTYAQPGTFATSVTVDDNGGSSVTISGSAAVAPAPLSAGTSIDLHATAVSPFNGTVASFSDANPAASVRDYAATISWGDGTPASAGTIAATSTPGQFAVSGTHTYAKSGSYVTSVTVNAADGASVTIAGSATVIAPALTAATSIGLGATEGTQFSGAVANFADANTHAAAGDYAATVTWGDGSTSAGTVSATGTAGEFAVTGTHTYAAPGNDTTSVTVNAADGASVTIAGSAAVADAALSAGPAATISAADGTAFTGTVGTFADANTAAAANVYTGTISWGDGASSGATITATGTAGQFSVSGTHTYASAGTFPISVSLADSGGSTVTLMGTATVSLPSINTVKVLGATGTAGVAINPELGIFTDADPGTTTESYSATISWGDGGTSAGSMVATGTTGEFGVDGTHTYASAGTYTVNATVTAPLARTFVLQTSATISAASTKPPTPPSKPPTPPSTPPLKLTLGHLAIVRGPAVTAAVTCPSGQSSCRGRLSAYATVGKRKDLVGSVAFTVSGGRSGSYKVRFSAALKRTLGHRRTRFTVSATATDPANGESGSTTSSFTGRV